jgi:hypothetical protein
MRQLGNIHISASISLRVIRSLTFCLVTMRDETQSGKDYRSWTNRGRTNSQMRIAPLNGIRNRQGKHLITEMPKSYDTSAGDPSEMAIGSLFVIDWRTTLGRLDLMFVVG